MLLLYKFFYQLVPQILLVVLSFFMGLLFKNFLPAYTNEKAKNLATKEDIAKITELTKEVEQKFNKHLESFRLDQKYKQDLYHRKYIELYSKLYVLLIQSEYIRYVLHSAKGKEISFSECPFFEIGPNNTVKAYMKYTKDEVIDEQITQTIVNTPISSANKKFLYELIIEKAELASPVLLKLAVSYRLADEHSKLQSDIKEYLIEEKVRLMKEIVQCILQEYNDIRKELNLSVDEEEQRKKIIKFNFEH